MCRTGRVLLLDDDKNFTTSAAELLVDQGFHCECVADILAAGQAMDGQRFDLLIAGIKKPDSIELEWVKSVKSQRPHLPIIIVSEHPSFQIMIESVQMRVFSTETDPFDWDGFLDAASKAIQHHHIFSWLSNLNVRASEGPNIVKHPVSQAVTNGGGAPVDMETFVDLALANIVGSLSDIRYLFLESDSTNVVQPVCHLFSCPRIESLLEGVREAIRVIEGTKSAFKSRRLKELRERLIKCVEG